MKPSKIPRSLARRAFEVQGWIELGCPEHALQKLEPLLAAPSSRPVALKLKISACIDLQRFAEAIGALEELEPFEDDKAWFDLTEAWCRKRNGELDGAVHCMERLLARNRHSAIGHFNLGCYLALRGDHERAIESVTRACGIDDSFRLLLEAERDLDSLRRDVRFRALLPPS